MQEKGGQEEENEDKCRGDSCRRDKCHTTFKAVLRGNIKGNSNMFQGLFHVSFFLVEGKLSWAFQECFKNVWRVFQENFHGVSEKFYIAWHSWQLPEQKEGLFTIDSVLHILYYHYHHTCQSCHTIY